MHRRLLVTILLAAVAPAGCRSTHWLRRGGGDPPPIAFAALPSPQEAVLAVNANTQRVQSLQTHGATVSIPGAPSIGAEIQIERPRRLRFRAGTQLLGPELDLGTNDELFWLWVARMPDSALYFARHDQFAISRTRQLLALEPAWLIEALGLVEIDPGSVIEGPHEGGNDRVRLMTTLPASGRPYTRLLILHSKYAWVLEQHVYDERGQLIASATSSGQEFSSLDGVSLPKRIEVNMPLGQMRFQLDVSRWGINQPLADAGLFDLPRASLGNYPLVDLADPNFVPPGGLAPPPPAPPRTTQNLQDEYQSRLRGYSRWR